jgi:NADH-quinone oxidoreductase subunit L
VHASKIPGAGYAYFCVMAGAFLTPLYIFRAIFLTFHGKSHVDPTLKDTVKESPWVILFPLLALAVPSMIAGSLLVGPLMFTTHLLGNTIFVLPDHQVLSALTPHFKSAALMALGASRSLPFWLALLGILMAWFFNYAYPSMAERLKTRFSGLYSVVVRNYGFDDFNQLVLVHGIRRIGNFFYHISDLKFIDGLFVNGSGQFIRWLANVSRGMQTGYVYHYAFVMMGGLTVMLIWLFF